MGSVYPVIEPPLVIKSRVEPFDSHYAVVDKFGIPCKPTDATGMDEIIVFSKQQVLPRLIFHFEQQQTATGHHHHHPHPPEAAKTDPLAVLPDELRDANPVILIVSGDLTEATYVASALKQHLPKLAAVKCCSSGEAALWLNKFGRMISARLCVITSCYREQDGGDMAWERVVQAVRAAGLQLHVLVLCNKKLNEADKIRDKASMWKRVAVIDEPIELLNRIKKVAKIK
jgi:3',5'-cyclic AMP phosphodiesterase CpdA